MLTFRQTSFVARAMTLALLTGCAGGNIAGPTVGGAIAPASIGTGTSSRASALPRLLPPGIPTSGTGGALHPFIDFAAIAKNKGPTIAISDHSDSVVDLFTAAGTQVGQLTGFSFPAGMASDVKGDLYVADFANSRIQIYAAGFASAPTTLSDPGQYPFDVDSFANGAYVAVTNDYTTSRGQGSVSIFKGSTLLRTITYSNLQQAYFCAFDGKGNLYVDGYDPNANVIVGEIPHATSGGSTFEQLTTTNGIGGTPGGIQVTTSGGQIAIEDPSNNAIYTYNPPSGGSLGTPAQVTPLSGSSFPLTFAFTKNMTDLYTADNHSGAFEYAYAAGGTPVSSFNVGLNSSPFGTAVIPTQYPSTSQ